ncbi:MAG TPA: SRPBCC family protein [Chloroflexota bacterium]|nr:SRPBCC family protein [Chloroflexota bacterium]
MSKTSAFLRGAGIGAAMMYFFDPINGRRRRALIEGKVAHLRHLINEGSQAASCDFGNRVEGLLARVDDIFSSVPEDNAVLTERVRARAGRLSCHPGAIFVTADNGCITLSGPILRGEVERVVHGISQVHGVRSVVNNLQVHETPGDIPGLQGECHPAGESRSFLDRSWSPTLRFAAVAGGGLLALSGLGRRGAFGTLLTMLGAGLATRGISNVPLRRLVGVGEEPVAFEVHKIIDVPAPIDEVYRIWAHPENFPLFMGHVDSVTAIAPDRFSWTVKGPAHMPISFETVVTRDEPNKFISWQTVHNALIPQTGRVLLQQGANGETRVDILICYRPPGGELGKLVAMIFGVSPKQALDDDMVRFKSLLANGKTTAHDQTVTRGRVEELDRTSRSNVAPRE